MADIKLFPGMELETESTSHWRLRKGDLVIANEFIYRIAESYAVVGLDIDSSAFELEPVWSLKTNREASGIPRNHQLGGDIPKVVLTY
ncbi:hypothetical protein [Saccharopolyspora sp. NPDC002376]